MGPWARSPGRGEDEGKGEGERQREASGHGLTNEFDEKGTLLARVLNINIRAAPCAVAPVRGVPFHLTKERVLHPIRALCYVCVCPVGVGSWLVSRCASMRVCACVSVRLVCRTTCLPLLACDHPISFGPPHPTRPQSLHPLEDRPPIPSAPQIPYLNK